MIPYITILIADFPKLISGDTVSPAAEQLFTVCNEPDSTKQPKNRAMVFHYVVTQLIHEQPGKTRDTDSSYIPFNMSTIP